MASSPGSSAAATEKAVAVLWEFLALMRDWESKFFALIEADRGSLKSLCQQAQIELRPIYEKYLTREERTYGRLTGAASFGSPPAFNPDSEKIVKTKATKDRKVVIETEWRHPDSKGGAPMHQHRYTMLCVDGVWRLDSTQSYHSLNGKWHRRML